MDQFQKDTIAQITAIELIVRGLFTKWAEEADDPAQSAFRMTEAMIGSLHEATKEYSDEQVELVGLVEDHLRRIGEIIQRRLAD